MQAAYLNQLSEYFSSTGLKVLGINLNSPSILNQVRPWINKRKINFDISVDPKEKLAKTFGVEGLPTLFLIDKDGNIINKTVGFGEGYEDKYLEALMEYLDSENISYQEFEYQKENKIKKDVTMEIDF